MSHSERPTILSNPHAERVKKVAALVGRSARQRLGLMLIEGPQAVRELLVHRAEYVRDVYLSAEAIGLYPELFSLACSATRWVHEVTLEVARAMSSDAQGVIAVAYIEAINESGGAARGFMEGLEGDEDLRRFQQDSVVTPSDNAEASAQGVASYVILAQGRDPGNVGTIIRTADAMGAQAVYLCAGTVDVTNPKVIRSSAGSVFHLPIIRVGSFDEAAAAVHRRGAVVLGTSGSHGALNLSDLVRDSLIGVPTPLTQSHAWAMGNEAQGLSDEELAACDHLVFIPMSGQAESLNVASAATICLYASQTVHMS